MVDVNALPAFEYQRPAAFDLACFLSRWAHRKQ